MKKLDGVAFGVDVLSTMSGYSKVFSASYGFL